MNTNDKRRIQRLNIRSVYGDQPVVPVKNERSSTQVIAKVLQEGGKSDKFLTYEQMDTGSTIVTRLT